MMNEEKYITTATPDSSVAIPKRMAHSTMDLYIYYRVAATAAAALTASVADMQDILRNSVPGGLHCGLKRRPQAVDGWHTWMEIYLGAPENFETQLSEAVAGSNLPALTEGSRHVEHFLECLPCA